NLGIGPESAIVPPTDPPSVTAVTSYPAVVTLDGGGGGISVVGSSRVPRPQLTIIANITPDAYTLRLRFMVTSALRFESVAIIASLQPARYRTCASRLGKVHLVAEFEMHFALGVTPDHKLARSGSWRVLDSYQ